MDVQRPSMLPKLAVILILLATATLAMRPVPALFDLPVEEDGFMVLTNSRHIARGDGVSYDGHTLNNGFQPLWVFLNAPLYRLVNHDPEKMVRATLALHWLFFLGSIGLIGAITRDAVPRNDAAQKKLLFWLGALAYGGAMAAWQKHFNGLETSCALFFYALTWRYYQSGRAETLRGAMGFGALLGLLVLARIDTVYLVVLLALQRLFIRREQPWQQRFAAAAATGGMALLVSLPWWVYNVTLFGHLTPASGLGLQEWGFFPKRIYLGIDAMVTMLTPYFYIKDVINLSMLGGRVVLGLRILVFLLLLAYLWHHKSRLGWGSAPDSLKKNSAQVTTPQRTLEFAVMLAFANTILLVWYIVSSWAWFFYERYFTPWMLLVAPAYGALLFLQTQRWRWLPMASAVVLAVPVIGYSLDAHRHVFLKKNIMLNSLLPLVKQHVPDTEWVALAQSGTVGYFRDRVVNLAGVSNMSVIPYQNHMWDYLDREGINWFSDWPDYVKPFLGNKIQDGTWVFVAERNDAQGDFKFEVYRRRVPMTRQFHP
ncbi:MAG: hypothetical protein H7833_14835 [Magnetococcus sp. DMHC-1]|nr:hypothetical protein [Magnetococcales bacterium]